MTESRHPSKPCPELVAYVERLRDAGGPDAIRRFAARARTSRSYLGHLVTGFRSPGADMMRRLSDASGGEVSVEALMRSKPRPKGRATKPRTRTAA